MDDQTPQCYSAGQSRKRAGPGQSTKDIKWMLSSRSTLSFNTWSYWGKLRTNELAVRGAQGSTATDKLCRRCRQVEETILHVISVCPAHSREMTGMHDRIQTVLMDLLRDLGIEAVPNARAEEGSRHVPNITVKVGAAPMFINVTAPFDEPANMCRAGQEKSIFTSERSTPSWLKSSGMTPSGRPYPSPIAIGTPPGCG